MPQGPRPEGAAWWPRAEGQDLLDYIVEPNKQTAGDLVWRLWGTSKRGRHLRPQAHRLSARASRPTRTGASGQDSPCLTPLFPALLLVSLCPAQPTILGETVSNEMKCCLCLKESYLQNVWIWPGLKQEKEQLFPSHWILQAHQWLRQELCGRRRRLQVTPGHLQLRQYAVFSMRCSVCIFHHAVFSMQCSLCGF